MPKIHDLLKLPETIRKGDFVQTLSSGIDHPEPTVNSYAITPAILSTYEHALDIIGSALTTGRSQAAYLHGSFGSGKSHFMAILNLMLINHAAPWERGEFHPLKEKFKWIGNKKLLQLPMHFLTAATIEDHLFQTYVDWVSKHHPDAPVPPLYSAQGVFEDARRLRERISDETFFEGLNAGRAVASGWGDLAQGAVWDEEKFDSTVNGTDDDARDKLFSALVKTYFRSTTTDKGRFIDLDPGLQALAKHAKSLGYDGVVLYLDELILWLAGHSSNLEFVQREIQKLVKFKEAQNDQRDIPIISFIARQRKLSQLVGEQARGEERAALEDSFDHHGGRFEVVNLADSNLPAIIEHRVLEPRDDTAKATLDEGFTKAWRSAGKAQATLIGSEGDERAFRKVFPFSPALVEALVDLSNCLQRERTAIRILMELLVEHLPNLDLGEIVPVGDAFDVIAGGEDPFDQVMRSRFDRARHLYEEAFLPMIRSDHGTETATRCQRMRDGHKKKIGCSGCPEQACRNDNRLAKTLLMAALVPGAKPFAGLTVKRVVHLNHGTIASPIPGAELGMAAQKLRQWSAQIGPLRIGEEADPEIQIHLEGIDLQPIIERASAYDTAGARKHALRKLLFTKLGLSPDTTVTEHSVVFRGVKRKGTVRYGNVREMADSQLRCPGGSEWHLVLDYPFDESQYAPADDVQRVVEYRERVGESEEPTLVWLPTFFSQKLATTLGELVAIDHILENNTQEYLAHLRQEDQIQARDDLKNLAGSKRDKITRALGAAYGLTSAANNPDLDGSRTVEEHIVSLSPTLTIGALLAGSLKDGLQQVVERLLEHRFPHHPRFGAQLTSGKLSRIQELLERIVESPDHRIAVSAADRKDLQHFADPLGVTVTTESRSILVEQPLSNLEQLRQQGGLQAPSVTDVRGFTDPQGLCGYTPALKDLIVCLYALWSGRSIVQDGRDISAPRLGQLPEDATLIRPELPTESEWHDALAKAGELFGITFAQRHLSARNLASFNQQLTDKVTESRSAGELALKLGAMLDDWAERAGAPRLTTAESSALLVSQVEQAAGAAQVRKLTEFVAETSATAVSKSLVTTATILTALRSQSRWVNFTAVRNLLTEPTRGERAQAILDDLATALKGDELNHPLAEALASLTQRAAELIGERPPSPPSPPDPRWIELNRQEVTVTGREGYAEALADLAGQMRAIAAEQDEAAELKLEVQVVLRRRDGAKS